MQDSHMHQRMSLLMAIIAGLAVVIVIQVLVMMRLTHPAELTDQTTASTEKTFQMDLQPNPGSGKTPSSGVPNVTPALPLFPYGSSGLDPDIWDPFQEFRSMRQQMDQMFSDAYGRFQQTPDLKELWGETSFAPSMDLEEHDDRYVVRMDIPGMEKSNITVNINDRELVVSGKIDETIEQQGKSQLRKERRTGAFKRALTLPGPIKADEMEADYKNGVLTITLPKGGEEGPPRNIEVK